MAIGSIGSKWSWLKRIQRGSEDEWIAGGPAAVNGMSSEILYLLDSAQGLFMPQGNTSRRVIGKLRRGDPESAPHSLYTSRQSGNQ